MSIGSMQDVINSARKPFLHGRHKPGASDGDMNQSASWRNLEPGYSRELFSERKLLNYFEIGRDVEMSLDLLSGP